MPVTDPVTDAIYIRDWERLCECGLCKVDELYAVQHALLIGAKKRGYVKPWFNMLLLQHCCNWLLWQHCCTLVVVAVAPTSRGFT